MLLSKPLVAASAKPLILGILRSGKNYGYAIIEKVKEISGGKLEWSDGMLYPVLRRLEQDGLVQSEWIISGNSRPRKYYSITEKGKKEILVVEKQWMSVHEVLLLVWSEKQI